MHNTFITYLSLYTTHQTQKCDLTLLLVSTLKIIWESYHRCRKSIWQNPVPIHDKKKSLSKLGTKGNFLNFVKNICKKPTAVKLKAFPLRSGTRQGCPLSPLLFKIILEVLANAVWPPPKKEIKGMQVGKEEFVFR